MDSDELSCFNCTRRKVDSPPQASKYEDGSPGPNTSTNLSMAPGQKHQTQSLCTADPRECS